MIVAGGGIIGLACAWRLARQRIPVMVFDAKALAREASWAAAGMLAPGGEMDEDSPLTGMALRSLSLYPKFIEELEEASATKIEYRRCGAITVAFTDEEAEALQSKASHQSILGIHSEYCKFTGAAAARFYPDDALVNPRDLTAALRTACVRSGVTIREYEAVTGILDGGKGVRTSQGEYHAEGVLIASGAWSSQIDPAAELGLPRTSPVRGHLVAWQSDQILLDAILRHANTYVLQRHCLSGRAGRIVAGGSTEHRGFDRTLDNDVCIDIQRRAAGLVPALAASDPADCWNGLRPAVDAAAPVIGRISETHIWTAFGHYRNGILLAPETARMIAESVAQC